jgi:HAD superfamily hydrolase (TIGR01484 family)
MNSIISKQYKVYNKMLVLDYDGTLAKSDYRVDEITRRKLEELEKQPVIRVINTGRSLFSLNNVIDKDFPVDYIVFSAGIGIYDWKRKEILESYNISGEDSQRIYSFLCDKNYDFMVQLPVPDNHYFHHFGDVRANSDFRQRVSLYESYGIKAVKACPDLASQFVVICPEGEDYFECVRDVFPKLNVVKATSPINNKSIWVEILPASISKASGIDYLMKRYNIDINSIVVVGNDYYDLDMLEYVNPQNAYVVDNSPTELKSRFKKIESNDNYAIAKLIDEIYFGS